MCERVGLTNYAASLGYTLNTCQSHPIQLLPLFQSRDGIDNYMLYTRLNLSEFRIYRRKPKEGQRVRKIREKNFTCLRLEINGSFISNTIITDFLTGTKGFSHVRSIGDILTAGGCKLCRFDLFFFFNISRYFVNPN